MQLMLKIIMVQNQRRDAEKRIVHQKAYVALYGCSWPTHRLNNICILCDITLLQYTSRDVRSWVS